MRCTVVNSTTGTRCKKTACAGLHICGLHKARTVPHELVQTGEKNTVYRDPDCNEYFGHHKGKIIFSAEREEPNENPDYENCKLVYHPWMFQNVRIKYINNKIYKATIDYIFKHTNGKKWCHVTYTSDGSWQDIEEKAFKVSSVYGSLYVEF